MSKVLIAALGTLMFVSAGCQTDGGSTSSGGASSTTTTTTRRENTSAAVDDCTMCAGNQVAKADGTCPKCGMKVASANSR